MAIANLKPLMCVHYNRSLPPWLTLTLVLNRFYSGASAYAMVLNGSERETEALFNETASARVRALLPNSPQNLCFTVYVLSHIIIHSHSY